MKAIISTSKIMLDMLAFTRISSLHELLITVIFTFIPKTSLMQVNLTFCVLRNAAAVSSSHSPSVNRRDCYWRRGAQLNRGPTCLE